MIRTFRPHAAPGLASCAFLLFASLAGAVETKNWSRSGQAEFEKGTREILSLSSDGRLTLAPAFRELADPSVSYLWALAADSKGNLYTGGGSPSSASAKLVAIDAAGKSRTLAELPGLQIQAIAVDKRDRVYAATAPDGKVYRVDTATGKFETFYDPKAKYIWSMAFNSRGDLFIGTGDGGEVHRVTAEGKGEVFFKTEETHARSLAVDTKDNVIVGTEPGGLILRISPAGEGFVVYQAARREVTSVAVNAAGVIYAAAIGNKSAGAGPSSPSSLSIPTPAIRPAPMGGPAPAAGGGQVALAPAPPPMPTSPPSIAGGSEVYRIATDNFPQRIWTHTQDIVYAIGFDAQGRPILGTGNKGNIYRIDSDLVSTLLVNASPTQVTAFAAGPKGRLFAATGNVGKVYQVGPELQKSGSYESEAMDAQSF
jgi:outer membrane protein assembly factor BamB